MLAGHVVVKYCGSIAVAVMPLSTATTDNGRRSRLYYKIPFAISLEQSVYYYISEQIITLENHVEYTIATCE
jgi:hypothetical protein